MKKSTLSSLAFVFLAIVGINSSLAASGSKDDEKTIAILNSATRPLNSDNSPSEVYNQMWKTDRNFSLEFAIAYINYLVRVASFETPHYGGDSLHNLSYENTYAIVKTLMRAPPSIERDRAVIIYWAFLASGSINFYINLNSLNRDFYLERSAAINRLGVDGQKLYIRALLEANWEYAGFAERHEQRNLFVEAFQMAKSAGLLQDAEIRGWFENHVDRSLDYVANLRDKEKMAYDEKNLWLEKQNLKSPPLALVMQIRTLLGFGIPQKEGLISKIKSALKENLFASDVSHDRSYYSSLARKALSAQKISSPLINVLENEGDLQALKKLFATVDSLPSYEFTNGAGKSLGEVLFEIEVRKPGTVQSLMALFGSEQELRTLKHHGHLYAPPSTPHLMPARLQAFKNMYRQGFASVESAIEFSMAHDLLKVDRDFALELVNAENLRSFGAKEIIVNRAVLGILKEKLNATQATYFSIYLNADLVPRAVLSLRDAGVRMSLYRKSNDGRDFRSAFENMTVAALFAKPTDLNSFQLESRAIKINSIADIIGGLYDGSLERGYRFDDAAKASNDRLFIAVVKSIRSGSQDPLQKWKNDLAEVAKASMNSRLFEDNSAWATDAVDFVISRLSADKLPEILKAFGEKVDTEALRALGFTTASAKQHSSGLVTCKLLLSKKSSR